MIFKAVIALITILHLTNAPNNTKAMEKEQIKTAIQKNYLEGAFNQTNIEAFKAIFPREFSIINLQEDGSFYWFTRDNWEKILVERKNNSDFDYSTIALRPVFRNISIEAKSASVTVDLTLKDKTIYTDFLLLKKHQGNWWIVSKIYEQH